MVTTATELQPTLAGAISRAFEPLYALIRPHETSKRSVFVQRLAGTFLVRVALIAIGFLTSIATARLLGPYGRGIYGAAIVLVMLITWQANHLFCPE
jgi:hypothetical protein